MMSINEKIERLKVNIQDSNRLSQELHQDSDFHFFENVSIPWTRVEPSELGFIRVVSWLYVLYIDIKKNDKNIQFLSTEKIINHHQNHIGNISRLRTFFQHQIRPNQNEADKLTKDNCDDFFDSIIFKDYPSSEQDWTDALHKILDDALLVNEQIVTGLSKISGYMEITKNVTINLWQRKLTNTHDKYEFELVFQTTIDDMGLNGLNTYSITEQNLQKWRISLEKLGYDKFEYNLRRIIEQELITQKIPPPVTGEDFIAVGVPKGPLLGQAITLATEIFYRERCEKDTLVKAVLDVLPR